MNDLFLRHLMCVGEGEDVEKDHLGSLQRHSALAEVTLTPGGHWCSQPSVCKWGQKVLERGHPVGSALKCF